ncbi:MAG: biotin/lipoyl-containing protein [Microbacterium sp.]
MLIEKYLDKPRHVETQCLADAEGNVVVISTRDCSLQRRHQKLVEEAPAPFLTDEQNRTLYESSKAILREVGYVGAGTCEFLIGADGTISFLEVNTRLQVEHPVSEEVTGIDLVREQFPPRRGGTLDDDDPEPLGHSIEFRINSETRSRLSAFQPGRIHQFKTFGGPGIRLDSGSAGDSVSGRSTRCSSSSSRAATAPRALERSRRAARRVRGRGHADKCCPSPVRSCATRPSQQEDGKFGVFTLDRDRVRERHSAVGRRSRGARRAEPRHRRRRGVEAGAPRGRPARPHRRGAREDRPPRRRSPVAPVARPVGVGSRLGRRREVADAGDRRQGRRRRGPTPGRQGATSSRRARAMKMEQPLQAHKDGVVGAIDATPGTTVSSGHQLLTIS